MTLSRALQNNPIAAEELHLGSDLGGQISIDLDSIGVDKVGLIIKMVAAATKKGVQVIDDSDVEVFSVLPSGKIRIGNAEVTPTVAELNVLSGIAGGLTAAELSILDGVTGVTAAELSYIGDVTGLLQAQIDLKAATTYVDGKDHDHASPIAVHKALASDHHTKYALTEDLTSGEITQIKLINANTISEVQWGYLGATNQSLTTAALTTLIESIITAEVVEGQSIDNAIDTLIATHTNVVDAHQDIKQGFHLGGIFQLFGHILDASPEEINAYAVHMSADGMHLYVCGGTGQDINQYDLTTPFDIRTASFSSKTLGTGTLPEGVFISPDGLKLYYADDQGNDVTQHTLATPWDLSSDLGEDDTYGLVTTSIHGLHMKADGTKFWVYATNNNVLYQYSMGTPWDLTTAATDGQSGNLATMFGTGLKDVIISADGYTLIAAGDNGTLYEAYMTTPFDVSTLVDTGVSLATGETVVGISSSPNGHMLYTIDGSDDDVKAWAMGTKEFN